jgi:predicted RNA binding protein with dsRBD fold (UPF0201 family)
VKATEITISALIRPTEDGQKVARAVENIFPGLSLEIRPDRLEATGNVESLDKFHLLLRQQRILDTARAAMLRNRLGKSIQFRLGKQAALAGRVNFPPDEEPLGSIHVQIAGGERLIDWLAPATENGVPVKEIDLEEALDV